MNWRFDGQSKQLSRHYWERECEREIESPLEYVLISNLDGGGEWRTTHTPLPGHRQTLITRTDMYVSGSDTMLVNLPWIYSENKFLSECGGD